MNARTRARAAARLAAVQALYQHAMEKTPQAQLLDEFHRHRLGAAIDEDVYADAEVAFFDDIVKGVIARTEEIDGIVGGKLAGGWTVARLDKTMLQILRAGTYELLARKDVPTGAAISEYVDVAHAFFEPREAKFVNGVLDAVAKDVR
ncbi:N utilization substance protein B [Novosphingobium marinum]|uniref:Transcription antitermination protein NusB n=1 Tax=Novosphingobium marinum TaxID=1514948 RepID=A0A7Y9XW71_9SPHN|nr:transcription antitermination factor NusB [Novosphingobium marinum]NYH94448.1 N utilization substance protein B [Novosphingobium marinum]GGC22411.1 N utilization substance protein B [Novosphingobium marinum]